MCEVKSNVFNANFIKLFLWQFYYSNFHSQTPWRNLYWKVDILLKKNYEKYEKLIEISLVLWMCFGVMVFLDKMKTLIRFLLKIDIFEYMKIAKNHINSVNSFDFLSIQNIDFKRRFPFLDIWNIQLDDVQSVRKLFVVSQKKRQVSFENQYFFNI